MVLQVDASVIAHSRKKLIPNFSGGLYNSTLYQQLWVYLENMFSKEFRYEISGDEARPFS